MKALDCRPENADKFLDWIANRGGLAVWRSANLSNPSASWTTPVLTVDGKPYDKPTWQAESTPERIIKTTSDVTVTRELEVGRFRVAIRRGGQGLSFKLTDASSRKLERALERAGEGATYVFDYGSQEAVILVPESSMTLAAYASQKDKGGASCADKG